MAEPDLWELGRRAVVTRGRIDPRVRTLVAGEDSIGSIDALMANRRTPPCRAWLVTICAWLEAA